MTTMSSPRRCYAEEEEDQKNVLAVHDIGEDSVESAATATKSITETAVEHAIDDYREHNSAFSPATTPSWFPFSGMMKMLRGGAGDRSSGTETPKKHHQHTIHPRGPSPDSSSSGGKDILAADSVASTTECCSTQWSIAHHDDDNVSFEPTVVGTEASPSSQQQQHMDDDDAMVLSGVDDPSGFHLKSPVQDDNNRAVVSVEIGESGSGEGGGAGGFIDFGGILESRFSACVAAGEEDLKGTTVAAAATQQKEDESEVMAAPESDDRIESGTSSSTMRHEAVSPKNKIVLDSGREDCNGNDAEEDDNSSDDDVAEESFIPCSWDFSSEEEMGSSSSLSCNDKAPPSSLGPQDKNGDDDDASISSDEDDEILSPPRATQSLMGMARATQEGEHSSTSCDSSIPKTPHLRRDDERSLFRSIEVAFMIAFAVATCFVLLVSTHTLLSQGRGSSRELGDVSSATMGVSVKTENILESHPVDMIPDDPQEVRARPSVIQQPLHPLALLGDNDDLSESATNNAVVLVSNVASTSSSTTDEKQQEVGAASTTSENIPEDDTSRVTTPLTDEQDDVPATSELKTCDDEEGEEADEQSVEAVSLSTEEDGEANQTSSPSLVEGHALEGPSTEPVQDREVSALVDEEAEETEMSVVDFSPLEGYMSSCLTYEHESGARNTSEKDTAEEVVPGVKIALSNQQDDVAAPSALVTDEDEAEESVEAFSLLKEGNCEAGLTNSASSPWTGDGTEHSSLGPEPSREVSVPVEGEKDTESFVADFSFSAEDVASCSMDEQEMAGARNPSKKDNPVDEVQRVATALSNQQDGVLASPAVKRGEGEDTSEDSFGAASHSTDNEGDEEAFDISAPCSPLDDSLEGCSLSQPAFVPTRSAPVRPSSGLWGVNYSVYSAIFLDNTAKIVSAWDVAR